MGSNFDVAMETVLKNEGGLEENASDPGGLTNMGLSQRSYPDLDLRSLTVEDAKKVYFRDFWLFQDVNSQPVATKLLDAYVNMKHNALRLAQRSLGITEDGAWGPQTLNAVNAEDPAKFLPRFRNELVDYYVMLATKNPSLTEFLPGWLKRARQ